MLTQSRDRELIVMKAESLYVAEITRMQIESANILEAFYAQTIDANVPPEFRALIKRLRGVFKNVERTRAVWGRLAGLVEGDVESSIRMTIPTYPLDKMVASKAVNAFAKTNADLITKVGDEVMEAVMKQLTSGKSLHTKALQETFQHAFGIGEARARLWARDQTLKLHGQITRERHEAVGIERYSWTDSNDERTRRIHDELGRRSDVGEKFSYKNPPIISEDGRRGNPGDDYQCRCTAYPDLMS